MHLKDLEVMLERLTFRRGEANGFPTRMLYGGDWVVDNHSRGNVKDLTEDYSTSFKTLFSIVQKLPENFIPHWLMNWLDRYTTKRINELKQQTIKQTWKNMYLQNAVDEIHNRQRDTKKAPFDD